MKTMRWGAVFAVLSMVGCGQGTASLSSAETAADDLPVVNLTVSQAAWETLVTQSSEQQPPSGAPPAGAPSGQPPEEAFTACEASAAGDACSVTVDGNTLEGVCQSGPDQDRLACVPNDPPPMGPGSGFGGDFGCGGPAAVQGTLDGVTVDVSGVPVPPGSSAALAVVVRSLEEGASGAPPTGVMIIPQIDSSLSPMGAPPAPPTPSADVTTKQIHLIVDNGAGAQDLGVYQELTFE